jgi:hypothetical protein
MLSPLRAAASLALVIGVGVSSSASAEQVTLTCQLVGGSAAQALEVHLDTLTNKVQFGPVGYLREDGLVRRATISDASAVWRYPYGVWHTLNRDTGVLEVTRRQSQYNCAPATVVSRF